VAADQLHLSVEWNDSATALSQHWRGRDRLCRMPWRPAAGWTAPTGTGCRDRSRVAATGSRRGSAIS